jgi:hypothetical protein
MKTLENLMSKGFEIRQEGTTLYLFKPTGKNDQGQGYNLLTVSAQFTCGVPWEDEEEPKRIAAEIRSYLIEEHDPDFNMEVPT